MSRLKSGTLVRERVQFGRIGRVFRTTHSGRVTVAWYGRFNLEGAVRTFDDLFTSSVSAAGLEPTGTPCYEPAQRSLSALERAMGMP